MTTAKFCPECGTATNGAKFCPECGTSTTLGGGDADSTPAAAEAPALTDESTLAAADAPAAIDAESATAAVGASTASLDNDDDDEETEIWQGTPDPVLSPMAAKTNSYVITNEGVKVNTGALRKRAESMELFRIKDISVKKTLTQRSRGRGDLKITSTDPSTPEITLESIQKPDEVAETLRKLVRDARRQHGVVTHERM